MAMRRKLTDQQVDQLRRLYELEVEYNQAGALDADLPSDFDRRTLNSLALRGLATVTGGFWVCTAKGKALVERGTAHREG